MRRRFSYLDTSGVWKVVWNKDSLALESERQWNLHMMASTCTFDTSLPGFSNKIQHSLLFLSFIQHQIYRSDKMIFKKHFCLRVCVRQRERKREREKRETRERQERDKRATESR